MFNRASRAFRRRGASVAPRSSRPRVTCDLMTATKPRYPCIRSRNLTTYESTRLLFKKHPFSMSVAAFSIIFGAGGILYANYIYKRYMIDQFHTFPEPVAAKLRRALYYSNIDVAPHDAIRYYREALAVADEQGMNPFCAEVIGIKTQLASFLEKIQQYHKAIEVLELVRADCIRWVEDRGGLDGNAGQRTMVLGRTVGMSVKLGELYAGEHVMDRDLAEDRLAWAVETVLKEKRRREQEGVKEGEGPWMSDEQVGGSLEALANNYEAKDQHYLSAPLYLQALTLIPTSDCHSAVLMNNLSICLAQQVPPPTPNTPPVSRPALVDSARAWALKAIEVGTTIIPPERTEECDVACAVATHNLGEFAEMDGDIAEARRRYDEARSLAKAVGFEEGVANAAEGIKRLDGKD